MICIVIGIILVIFIIIQTSRNVLLFNERGPMIEPWGTPPVIFVCFNVQLPIDMKKSVCFFGKTGTTKVLYQYLTKPSSLLSMAVPTCLLLHQV